jgi:glycosyltransferase involved in cell wall biosynthesis
MDYKKLVVFLPAYNEEESIALVIKRIPRNFDKRIKVEVVVVDDGSSDNTVKVSKAAGADYIYQHETNKGLGAAVRTGLKVSAQRGADIAVMIDADNEYPADEIPNIVYPLLIGEADYTMGSRFLGTIEGMKLHRRVGNYCFTMLQSILLRKFIYDGQSGMRAFSREAMINAEIIHDYNYAQVLTLNLVRKGFRVKEIPIRYQVRAKGESFIKFRAYVISVLPAVYKEMKRPVTYKKEQTSKVKSV